MGYSTNEQTKTNTVDKRLFPNSVIFEYSLNSKAIRKKIGESFDVMLMDHMICRSDHCENDKKFSHFNEMAEFSFCPAPMISYFYLSLCFDK